MKAPTRTYEDIIGLPRPVSPRRTRISPLGRAAQFAPFAALSGFEEEIDETARLTDRCPELSEEDFLRLNTALYELMGCLHEQPEVTLALFQPDEKKPGGALISVTGHVRRIDEANREIILTDGRSIPFGKVHSIARISRAGEGKAYCG